MFKYFTANNTRRYVDVLDNLVSRYNNARHTSIKMTLEEASLKKNENIVWRKLYGIPQKQTLKPRFLVGDRVRISKKKRTFEKGYTANWTEEIFTIYKVQYTDLITYKITDLNGEEIQELFTNKSCKRLNKRFTELKK